MTNGNKSRGLRLGVAAVAAGLGYVYHALSQQRSVRSKLIEDTSRVSKELQKGRSPQVLGEQLQRRISDAGKAAINNDIKARYNMFTKQYQDGAIDVIRGGDNCETRPNVIYLHGGQRIDSVSNKEWHFVGQLAEMHNFTIMVPQIELLPKHTFAAESDRLVNVIRQIKAADPDKEIIVLGHDVGAMYALNIAAKLGADKNVIGKVILISPWLDATLSDMELLNASQQDFEQDLEMMQIIQRVWVQQEPLVNMAEMPVTQLPPIAIISGTYDMHEPVTYHFYKRVRAKNPNTYYYRFDRMMHTFFLQNIPESEEVMQLIGQIIYGQAPVKRAH